MQRPKRRVAHRGTTRNVHSRLTEASCTGVARPTHLARAHSGVIRSLVFVPSPQPSLADRTAHDTGKTPSGIVAVGYDGVPTLCDLRAPDLAVTSLYQQRGQL